MTPRMSEGGLVPAFIQSPTRSTTRTKDETTQLATPPPSQSPPDMSPLSDKSTRQQSNDGGDGREGEDGETITQTSGEAESTRIFNHLSKDAIPADFLDSALADRQVVPDLEAAAYPSPSSALRPPSPPPTSSTEAPGEGETRSSSIIDKLEERISRTKERNPRHSLKLDTTTSSTSSTDPSPASASLPLTPTSPALPPRPSSRPPSRPPSISRRQSEYSSRTRSPSTTTTGGGQDPKRLSVSSSNGVGGLQHSPRLNHYQDGGDTNFTMPPSPLGPSRRTSSQNVVTTNSPSRPTSASVEEVVEPWEVKVTVRDWAYPESDPRHLGFLHPDLVPSDGEEDEEGDGGGGRFRRNRSSRSRQRRQLQQPQEVWTRQETEEEEEDRQGLGLGSPIHGQRSLVIGGSGSGGGGGGGGGPSPSSTSSFSWGFVTSHSTDFPSSSPASSSFDGDDEPRGYSFNDADNFGSTSSTTGASGGTSVGGGGYYSNGQDESEIEEELGLGEFVPGVYQAVYEFIPELETEMKLSVGEWVSVFERQCAGWVQAGRIVEGVLTEEVGLVPENYLHRLDFEDGEGELIDPSTTEEKETSTAVSKPDHIDGDGGDHDWKPVVDGGNGDTKDEEEEEERRREDKESTPIAETRNV